MRLDYFCLNPQTISLTGIGSITSMVVYPILVNFGNVAAGSTASAPVTLANDSNRRITIPSITTNPAVYAESNNCGTSLAPGLSCTTTATFTPAQAGIWASHVVHGPRGRSW
jgi:hypothetical protein